MVFSSLIFAYGFLPPVIILAFLTRRRIQIQNVILLLASLIFYLWGEQDYIWLFIGTIFINWLLVLMSTLINSRKGVRAVGICAIIFDLGILLWFKYARWIGGIFNLSVGSSVLPIGISFYTFQAISYVADVTLMEKYPADRNPVNVGLYIAYFPQLIAGPIVRYEDLKEQIKARQMTMDGFELGCFRFILGFCKKVLLADSMAVIANKAFSDGSELTLAFAWLGAVAYAFQIFMDFSGYSDMAIGLGEMFGFEIPENFNNPYKASTIRDFWRRWHITLSVWFRDYVYIPLGGSRKGRLKTIANIAIVWLLTGIWHGANLTFIRWGVTYGLFVLAEKVVNIQEKLSGTTWIVRLVYRLVTLLVILLLWVVFRADNISSASTYIIQMFMISPEGLPTTLLYLSEFKWAIFMCIILSVVSTKTIMNKRTWLWPVMLLLFIVSLSYLVKGTFSPFLYFNF